MAVITHTRTGLGRPRPILTPCGLTFEDVVAMHDWKNVHYRVGVLAATVKFAHETLVKVKPAVARNAELRKQVDRRLLDLERVLNMSRGCFGGDTDYLRPETH